MHSNHVLIIDDDEYIRDSLQEILKKEGFEASIAPDGLRALDLAKKDRHAVAIIDLTMSGISGIETVRQLKSINDDIEIIIFTRYPSLETSIDAIHEHVFDYICKPVEMSQLVQKVKRAAERRRLILDNEELLRQLEAERARLDQEVRAAKRAIEHRLENSNAFIGKSMVMQEIRHQIAGVAPSSLNVLLLGESGTGKDVIANLIHESSGRDPQAFVKVNCPAIPESLIESELFGHEAGAFTGALRRKPGRFELAAGGTLFLDEIGELPLSLQSKLLQAVEQKQFYTVGGKKPIHIDVRIIAATNAPLAEMIGDGRFRPDLYYRLNEYSISIPSLTERKEDIALLVKHFLETYTRQFNCANREFSPEVLSLICSHHWPGNIRELQSVIRRFALTGKHDDLLRFFGSQAADNAEKPSPSTSVQNQEVPKDDCEDNSKDIISAALIQANWNRRHAAKALGISYSTLRRRIEKYGLDAK